jgi:tetratricopeptide (TPR) repeat protein
LARAAADSAALSGGEQALALDSLNSEAAMLVGRLSCLAGAPGLAAKVLTPALRQSGAPPELYALRALAHELDRDYSAALADLKRTGPLLPDFEWIATGILGMALEEGRLKEARAAFELAMELSPDDATTLTLGVSLAQRLGDPKLERSLLRALRASAP